MSRRRPGDDELLDARLRAAAEPLADEPMPEGILEMVNGSRPGFRRLALALVIVAGLLAIAVGIGLSRIGPPDVAHGSPIPSPSSSPTRSMRAEPSVAPSPPTSQAPALTEQPPMANLVTAGSACGDGRAGFAFMVPPGWFANRAVFDTPACRYVADAPFDVPAGTQELGSPILIRVLSNAIPDGDAMKAETDIPTEASDRFATRYEVNRAGAGYDTFVVPLIATADGVPLYVHLEAIASDASAVAALEAIIQRLVVREPLTLPPDTEAAADALYADVDGCINVELGFATSFPESWRTNTPVEGVPGCSYLAPTSFEVPDDPSIVPDGVAITIRLFDGDFGTMFGEITGYESFVVDGRPAVRSEVTGPVIGDGSVPISETYQVSIVLGEIPEFGPNLVLSTGGDPLHRAILDRVVETLRISPPPPEVVARPPLPSCGHEVTIRLLEGDVHDAEARACLWNAYQAGEPAEFISITVSVEGGRILEIWRVVGPGDIELYVDSTHDFAGGPGWQLYRCVSLEGIPSAEEGGMVFAGIGECDHPIQLEFEVAS